MNQSIKKVAGVLLVVAVLSAGLLSGASDIWAKEKPGTLAKQIQGTWTLVSIYNEQDGKKIEPFGSQPRGSLILTPDGRFSMIFIKANMPKFAANNRMQGTAEENQAVVQGSHAYFGTYAVASEKEHTVNMHVEGSTFPNTTDQDQKRVMTVKGDELNVTNPTPTIGGVAYVVWKRAK
jgi:hypothetical protein